MLNTPSELSADETNTDDLDETPEELEESTEAAEEGEELEESEGDSEEDESEAEAFLVGDEKITLDEFKELKKNQMLHADYTRKRQAETAELKTRISEIDSVLEQADTLEAFLDEDEKNVDWDDFVSNSEMRKVEAKFKERRKKIEQLRKQAKGAKSKVDARSLEETNQAVFNHFTDWQDNDKTATADQKRAYDYALSIGHTAESIAAITDPQTFIALIEAAKYHEIKNAKPEKKLKRKAPKAVKGKKSPPKVAKSDAELFYGS
jgi:hypothetical protein